jgi:hypothetical protein
MYVLAGTCKRLTEDGLAAGNGAAMLDIMQCPAQQYTATSWRIALLMWHGAFTTRRARLASTKCFDGIARPCSGIARLSNRLGKAALFLLLRMLVDRREA